MAEFVKGTPVKEKAKPTYDPNKAYKWDPADQFVLDGMEFATLYNFVKNDIYTPGGAAIKQKIDAFTLLEKILSLAVEAGVAVVYTQPEPEPLPMPDIAYIDSNKLGSN